MIQYHLHALTVVDAEHFFYLRISCVWPAQSLISERTQFVSESEFSDVKYGVPQGSVLGPLFFSLNISLLGQIIHSHGINFHCHADDSQLYVSVRADDLPQLLN